MPDLDIAFYRKASISISVFNLGFGDVRNTGHSLGWLVRPGCVT